MDLFPSDYPVIAAHIALGIALGTAKVNPGLQVVVPCATSEVLEVMEEAVLAMATEVEEAQRIIIIYSN